MFFWFYDCFRTFLLSKSCGSMCIPDILNLISPNIEYKPVSSDKTKERLKNVFNECKCYQCSARKIYAEDSMFLEKNNLSIEFAEDTVMKINKILEEFN